MKYLNYKKIFILASFSLRIFIEVLPGWPAYENSVPADHEREKVKLVIFFPVEINIKILSELKKERLLQIDDLEVLGIYHEKELTDFSKAKRYVRENNIDWFKFRELKGDLSMNNIFRKNGCTSEFDEIINNSDGIIFLGGNDIQPQIYGQKTSILTEIQTPYRHLLALSAAFHLLGGSQNKNHVAFLKTKPEFPVLGICLGCQILNVGTGGTMIQDIWFEGYGKKYLEDVTELPIELLHRNPYAQLYPEERLSMYLMHPIKLVDQNKFCSVFGFSPHDKIVVSSGHHQMLGELGKDMKITATSLDRKVVEAIEHERFPNVLGVQFHPEIFWLWDRTIKFRFSPQDKNKKSFATILEENPPSYEFHEKLWLWFSEKLKESRNFRENLK